MADLTEEDVICALVLLRRWARKVSPERHVPHDDLLVVLDCQTSEEEERLKSLLRSMKKDGKISYSRERGWSHR